MAKKSYGIHIDGFVYNDESTSLDDNNFANEFLDFIVSKNLNFGGAIHVEVVSKKGRCPMAKSTPTKKGMGFDAAKEQIAKKEGIPEKNAAAILAASARKASPAAKAANPNLKNVKGAAKKK